MTEKIEKMINEGKFRIQKKYIYYDVITEYFVREILSEALAEKDAEIERLKEEVYKLELVCTNLSIGNK